MQSRKNFGLKVGKGKAMTYAVLKGLAFVWNAFETSPTTPRHASNTCGEDTVK